MYIARILYPVRVLGPGNRVGIWFSGCPHGCPGCSNPELWGFHEPYRTDADTVLHLLNRIPGPIDGFTLTGGDPFAQPEALAQLLPRLREINPDILVYSGWQRQELEMRHPDLLSMTAVLIDGRYIEERNNGCFLRGSDNQEIHILQEGVRSRYEAYLREGRNEIQNFTAGSSVISVGIHRPGYDTALQDLVKTRGLEETP